MYALIAFMDLVLRQSYSTESLSSLGLNSIWALRIIWRAISDSRSRIMLYLAIQSRILLLIKNPSQQHRGQHWSLLRRHLLTLILIGSLVRVTSRSLRPGYISLHKVNILFDMIIRGGALGLGILHLFGWLLFNSYLGNVGINLNAWLRADVAVICCFLVFRWRLTPSISWWPLRQSISFGGASCSLNDLVFALWVRQSCSLK